MKLANVRFGSKADIPASQSDVRFTPESGHSGARSKCPLSAKADIPAIERFSGSRRPATNEYRGAPVPLRTVVNARR